MKKNKSRLSNYTKKTALSCHCCEQGIVCPYCGSSRIREIIYGLLHFKDEDAFKEFEKKYVAGGCVIRADNPRYYCDSCKKKFGRIGDLDNYPASLPRFISAIKKLTKEKEKLETQLTGLRDTEKILKDSIKEYKRHLKKLEKRK